MSVASGRILICGLGSIGRRHLRNLQELGVADIVLLRTGKGTLAEELDYPTASSLEQALSEFRPASVLVTNPTSMHGQTAAAAAASGANVFVEKPIASDMQSARTLQAAVESAGVQLAVGYQFRFDPGLIRLRELLQSGELGQPISASAHWGEYLPDWHPWEDYRRSYSAQAELGGGVVYTLSHPIDYLIWLLGPVDQVRASVIRSGQLDIGVDDLAEITLWHASGGLSHVHLDYHRRPARHDLELLATGGVARWDGRRHQLSWRFAGEETWQTSALPEEFDRNQLFVEEMKHWLAVAAAAAEPACTLDDGMRALQVCLAAHESSDQRAAIRIEPLERSLA